MLLAAQVELKQDLVGSCIVGDVITVLGLVKVLATGEGAPGKQQKHCQEFVYTWCVPVTDI